jgi:hypothetical protein
MGFKDPFRCRRGHSGPGLRLAAGFAQQDTEPKGAGACQRLKEASQ